MRPSILFTVAAALVLTVIPMARAAPRRVPPIQLTYTRGAGAAACPTVGTLQAAVLKNMGYDPFDPSATRRLEVSIERRAEQYVATLELWDEAAQKVWSDEVKSRGSCRTLVEAVGLVIVIHVDPPQEPEPCPVCPEPPAPPSPPPAPPPAAEVREVPPPSPEPPPPPPAPPQPVVFRLGAALWEEYATMPRLTPAIALSAGVRYDWLSATIEGRWDPPYALSIPFSQVDLARLISGVVVCAHLAWFAHCGVAEGGAILLSENPNGLQSPAVAYGAFGTRITGELAVWREHLLLQIGAELLASVVPNDLVVHTGPTSQVPHIAGGFGVGGVYTIEKKR